MSIATFPDVVFPDSINAIMDFDSTALFQDSVTYNGTVTKNGTTVKEGPVNFLSNVTATSAGSVYLFDNTTAGTGSTVNRDFKVHAQNAVNGDTVNLEMGQSATDYAAIQYTKGSSGSSLRTTPDPTNDADLCFYMDYTGAAEVRSTGGTKTYGVGGDGSIYIVPGVGGTGPYTEPSIATGSSNWTPNITQSSGPTISNIGITQKFWYRKGNVVKGCMFFRGRTNGAGAGSEAILNFDLPVATTTVSTTSIIGSVETGLAPASFEPGIQTCIRGDGGLGKASLIFHFTNASVDTGLKEFSVRFQYIVN